MTSKISKIYMPLVAVLLLTTLAFAQAPAPADVEQRVNSILGQMTLEEKVDYIGGVNDFFIRDIPRLHLPRFKMADGPLGVRNFGPATAMAGGISLAATWDPALAERVGTQIGRDARAKGVHFLLGPGVNIYRAPMNGRNFEYFGEDPFLASTIAVGYIKGVQSQGVSATIKHYMGNNSEFDRHNTDSIIDERTEREIYLPVFEAAVKQAHVGAVMDSYNLTNGEHLTQNSFLNNDVLKKQWGFDGVLMSDWTSTYDAVAAANGGLDLEMPDAKFMNRKMLMPAIQSGKVTQATIDDKVRRILRKAAQFGWLDRDQTDLTISRYNQQGREVALEAAREGMVLLKNDGNILPLNAANIRSIAVIGPDAHPAVPVGGGSARVEPFRAISFLEGISNHFGGKASVVYNRGIPSLSDMAQATNFSIGADGRERGMRGEYFDNPDLGGRAVETRTDQHVNFGPERGSGHMPDKTQSQRWTGYFTPQAAGPHDIFVQSSGEDGGYYRLYLDDKPVLDNWKTALALTGYVTMNLDARPYKVVLEHHGRSSWLGTRLLCGIVPQQSIVDPAAKALASRADAVVLAVGFDPQTESEGADRTFRLPPGQEQLIQEIAAANKNTIVAITSGGSVDMTAWLNRVPALIQAWYPGQEGGTALAEILAGDVNPSGRLPVSFERRWEDNPVHDSYYPQAGTNRVVYKEGVFVGYRGYEHNKVKPLFTLGFGLSYTTVSYSNLAVAPGESGTFNVTFDVSNNGTREGSEVAQVYVADTHARVPRPAKELKGFQRVHLRPGETQHVSITLNPRALAYYDVNAKQWRADAGDFGVLVGRSAEQIELTGKLTLSSAWTSAP